MGEEIKREDAVPSVQIIPREPFYTETVKKRKRGMVGFGGLALLVVLASVGFGAGLGIAVPVTKNILSSSAFEEPVKTGGSGTSETTSFTLDNNASQSSVAVSGVSGEASSYSRLIELAEPSVVSIISTQTLSTESFGGFFGGSDLEIPSAGSGILFHETDSNYYIATNYHVIQGTSQISVSIEGSGPIQGQVLGGDPNNDIAVVSVSRQDAEAAGIKSVKTAVFGNSSEMKVGDVVLAIGNALGEGNTATNGIISAIDKSITIDGITLRVLQTNAAINPGNSGGPLINMKGEVIGINTAKISESSTEGMGYSIPSDTVKPLIEEIMDVVNKPFVGVQLSDLTQEAAKQYSLPSAGAIVIGVISGSPAEKSGIQKNDIITSYNDKPVLSSQQLIDYVAGCNIGDSAVLKVIRNGSEYISIELTLGHR